ncbi:MAG: Uma2 family endonuclease [Chloroflexota bacterium]
MSAQPVPPLPPDVLLTVDEVLQLSWPAAGTLELHDGRVVEVPPPSPRHGTLQAYLAQEVGVWCDAHGMGRPATELACQLTPGQVPGRVVGPDVAYVRPGPRWEAALDASMLQGPPDLAIEIVSPSDTPSDVRRKVQWYLEAG